MSKLDSKLMKFIQENINKGQYIEKNIEVSEDTSKDYFVFQIREDNESYSIFAKADIEMPKDIAIPGYYANKPVVSIGKNAFSNSLNRIIKNEKIETVIIPENIMNISDEAFKSCIKLKKVIIYGNRVPAIGSKVFMNTDANMLIYVPSAMVEQYKKDPKWSEYKDKIVGSDVPPYPEETPNQDGIVNTVVTTIVDSKDVSVAYNFYFLNINNSDVKNYEEEEEDEGKL